MHEVVVQATMRVLVDSDQNAMEVAQRWLPYQRELPLGCSDGAQLVSVDLHILEPHLKD